jgi:Ca-activated chloride channel family protein
VTLAEATWNDDLELFLPLTRGLVGMSLITHQRSGESDGYFMVLLAPGQVTERTLRRDVVGVLDISGSMSGEKMDQAKTALVQLVGTLRAGDRFRLIAFSSAVRRASAGWTDVTPANVAEGQSWVRSLNPEGGTNIAGALAEAFAAPPAQGSLGIVVFLTDGLPTVGETGPERIADAADRTRGQFRVFSFGIGFDVNTYLLDRLTEQARGATEYVGPGGNIESAVGSLTSKIATPVLTDLALSGDGVELYDLQPGSLPDLFAGDEMVVLGRYRANQRGPWGLTVTGRRAGRTERFTTSAPTDPSAGSDYVAHLWATRKAGALGRAIRLRGQTPEIMNELRDLALRYGILTEYTAYLVQEPGVVASRPPNMRLAPAPSQQIGDQSVAKARRDAQSASSAVAAEARELDAATRGQMGSARTQQVAGRVFVWRDSVWTDLRHVESGPVVAVAAFSDAYFALMRALPEIAKAAALEPTVLVAGRRVSIKIGAQGKTTWSTGEVEALVRNFRG